ncbi:MAG: hypothetical protein HUU47_08590 [Bacteroidetes bacterium]|nr:hypothetical protein [Bacteroidota bacterium]
MISIYYSKNEHIEIANDLALIDGIEKSKIIWVDMLDCNDSEILKVETLLEIKAFNRQDFIEIEESARFIEFENYLMCNSNFIVKEKLAFISKIVNFFIGKNFLVTYRNYNSKSFSETSKKLLSHGSKMRNSEIFLNIIDLKISSVADYVEDIAQEISKLSKEIVTNKHTSKLLILKLSQYREYLIMLMQNCIEKKLLISFVKKASFLNNKTESELDISVKDLESVIDYIKFNFERLDFIDSTMNNLIIFEQNNSIRLFTIVSIFFMPPMLIASIYGMNFKIIPELGWANGYYYSLAFMLLTVIVTFIYFKIKKWL